MSTIWAIAGGPSEPAELTRGTINEPALRREMAKSKYVATVPVLHRESAALEVKRMTESGGEHLPEPTEAQYWLIERRDSRPIRHRLNERG